MGDRFQNALKLILGFEGGYTNDPDDLGGATNLGITQREYDTYRVRKRLPTQSVAGITAGEAAEIYLREYWQKGRGGNPAPADVSDPALQLVLFDTGVNPRRGIWQKIAAILSGQGTDAEKAEAIIREREALYRARAAEMPSQGKFLEGWLNRMNGLRAAIGGVPPSDVAAEMAGAAQRQSNAGGSNLFEFITKTLQGIQGSVAKGARETAIYAGFVLVAVLLIFIIVRGE